MARNKSFFLIMPLLDFPADFLDSAGFINSFVRHSDFPEMKNHVFILCDHFKSGEKNQVTHKLRNDKQFVSSVVYTDLGYELFIFSLEDRFKADLMKFIKGEYSHISEEAKQRIMKIFMPIRKGRVTKNFATLYPQHDNSREYVAELEEKIGMELVGDFQILSRAKKVDETFKLSDLFEMYEEKPIQYLQLV
jgi:hypothetical protein